MTLPKGYDGVHRSHVCLRACNIDHRGKFNTERVFSVLFFSLCRSLSLRCQAVYNHLSDSLLRSPSVWYMILSTEIELYSKDLYVRESHIKVKYIIIATENQFNR
jgi:hypothetical protein